MSERNDHTVMLIEAKLQAATQDKWQRTVDEYRQRSVPAVCLEALEKEAESNALLFLRGPRDSLPDVTSGSDDMPVADLQLRVNLKPVADYGWWQRQPITNPQGMLLTLFAMHFPDADTRDQFVEATRSHSAYCWENEPDTQVYGLGIVAGRIESEYAIKTEDLMVVMICTDQTAMDKHRDDPRHLKLGAQIAELGIDVENTFAKTYRLTAQI